MFPKFGSYFRNAYLWKIVRAVYDVEEATSTAFDIILEHKVNLVSFGLRIYCSSCVYVTALR